MLCLAVTRSDLRLFAVTRHDSQRQVRLAVTRDGLGVRVTNPRLRAVHCKKHRLQGARTGNGLRCVAVGCNVMASFGPPLTRTPRRCRTHRLESDHDTRHARCVADGCTRRAYYGEAGGRSLTCLVHKLPSYIDTCSKRCEATQDACVTTNHTNNINATPPINKTAASDGRSPATTVPASAAMLGATLVARSVTIRGMSPLTSLGDALCVEPHAEILGGKVPSALGGTEIGQDGGGVVVVVVVGRSGHASDTTCGDATVGARCGGAADGARSASATDTTCGNDTENTGQDAIAVAGDELDLWVVGNKHRDETLCTSQVCLCCVWPLCMAYMCAMAVLQCCNTVYGLYVRYGCVAVLQCCSVATLCMAYMCAIWQCCSVAVLQQCVWPTCVLFDSVAYRCFLPPVCALWQCCSVATLCMACVCVMAVLQCCNTMYGLCVRWQCYLSLLAALPLPLKICKHL